MARIPGDVVHYKILPRLPYKSLSRFKCVCKNWHHLISHDIVFAHEQSRHGSPISFGCVYQHKQSINFVPIDVPGELNVRITGPSSFSLPNGTERIRITAAVNGLLLLFLQRKRDEQNDSMRSINHQDAVGEFHYVWNFVTKEGHFIPEDDHRSWFVGLAFDPSITPACYRLVHLAQQRKGLQEEFSFEIYSSRTRKWTMSDHKIMIPEGKRIPWDVFCGGRIIYWNCSPYALWFEVDKDVAGCTLLPEAEDSGSQHALGVTNDGLLTSTRFSKNDTITIWTMSEDGAAVPDRSLPRRPPLAMEMRKVACAVLVAAASATGALAAEAPAPGPASASFAVTPAVGAVIGASVLSFFAFYLQ
ncbi:hypothetical protein MUK42_31252 [Musa troglodytarum]|uniref:F-box domain-containing protein n=2 Tax=Musa TaxID=4640 RepID=A0A9E7GCD8_9LILI|nr:hypothetical protein MUK42_31252 [Musa troglodytarum]